MNIEKLKNILKIILKTENYQLFLESFSFEERKHFVLNYNEYNALVNEILTYSKSKILLANLFTNSEADSLIDEKIMSYIPKIRNIILVNASEKEKLEYLNSRKYLNYDYEDIMISLSDQEKFNLLPKIDRYIIRNIIESINDGHLKRLAIIKYYKLIANQDIILFALSLENTKEMQDLLLENGFDYEEIIAERKSFLTKKTKESSSESFYKIRFPKTYYLPLSFIQNVTAEENIVDALECVPELFKWLSKEEQNNPLYAIRAINKAPFLLEIVSNELKNNYDIVFTAVNKQGLTLEYASIKLRDNEDIVTCAINNNFRAFENASFRIKNNLAIIKKLALNYVKQKSITLEEQATKNLNIFLELYGKNLFNGEIEPILKDLFNENMLKLFNMSDKEFKLILGLFDNTKKITERNIGNIKETIIQKEFSINNDNILNKFSTILNLIKNNNYEQLCKEFVEINKYINTKEILIKNNLTFHEFLVQLLQENQNAISILHSIINSYIDKKREEYLKERLINANSELILEKEYDKTYLIKKLLNNDINDIISIIKSINFDDLDHEIEKFIRNKKLLEDCLMYRKDNTITLTSDIKKNLYLLNKVFDKLYRDGSLNYLAFDDNNPIYSTKIPSVSNIHILNILNSLDFELIKNNLLNNNELYSKLLNILNNYQLIAWQNIFDNMLQKADMYVDEMTIANFINYFYEFYPLIEKDINSGLIKDIRLTRLLEEASSYNSYLSKTRLLVGGENYRFLSVNAAPNKANAKKIDRLKKVPFLVREMYKRSYVSVPPLNEILNINNKKIHTSLGNFTNPINLTLGERTGSCMRIKGQADTLLDFCSLDKNGFHIIFQNEDGELVSRVSGFRNGNTIFLNQLRESIDENITNQDLRDAIYEVANLIVEKSKGSSYPIENVLISNAMVMNQEKLVEIKGPINFKQDLAYNIDDYEEEFYSDIKPTNCVLLNKDQVLKDITLSPKTVQYECLRSPIKIIKNANDILNSINRLHIINALLNNQNYEEITINKLDLTNVAGLIYGDDWYITFNSNNQIIDKFYIENPLRKDKAIQEMEEFINNHGLEEIKKSNFKLT